MSSSFFICSTIIANKKEEMLFFDCSVVFSVSSVTIFLQIYPYVLQKCCSGIFTNCRNARKPFVCKGFRALVSHLVLFPLATTKPTLNDFVLAFWYKLIAFGLDYPNYIGYPNFCYHFAITCQRI